MSDLTQILLTVVITALTIVLVMIGLQLVKILQESKRTVEKINKILDDAGLISGSIAKPLSGVSGFLEGFKGSFQIIETIMSLFSKKEAKKKERGEDGNE